MDEHAEVIEALREAGVLVAIRWAYESAVRRALETYSPEDGHDTAWLGNTRYVLFRDRLDRALRCGRYAMPDGDATDHPDGLFAELSEQDSSTLPHVKNGTVVRHDLHGSPGWACGAGRFLIASADFGFVRTLPWAYKSRTKRIVAMQKPPVMDFEDVLFGLHEVLPAGPHGLAGSAPGSLGLAGSALDPRKLHDLPTFVVAHSLEPISGQTELILGRPRMNAAGGPAWYWLEDLSAVDLPATGRAPLARAG
ncbi:MAG TPA: hypothetical protein VMG38_17700 [Trebonia sp.]|nr:hypothetical protein [Trebonia sp.]